MANFCMKCGSPLDSNGLCPHCDAPPAPRFCTRCGIPMGADGRCPHCDAPPAPQFCTRCGAPTGTDGLCPHCDTPVMSADAPTEVLSEEPTEEPGATVLLNDDPTTIPLQDYVGYASDVSEPTADAPANRPTKKASPVTVILTVLLSVCLFITTTVAVSVLTVRHTISEGGMANLAEQVDIAEILKTTGAANGETFDEFYQRLERDYGVCLDDQELGKLLEDSTVPEYVADKISEFADDFFAGEAELIIDKDEMVDLLWDNRELIEDEIPAEFTAETGIDRLYREDCETIADWMFNGDDFVLLSTDDLRQEVPALYQGVTIGLSYLVMGFFLVLSLLLLFLMCRNSLSQAAIGGGIVLILLGGLTSLAAAVVAWVPGLWVSIAGHNPVLSLLGSALVINAPIFVILLAVGILLPILRAVILHVVKK